uniref:uncharacterized protein LOC122604845 n=1 Tax=Erigeron canadensis TaxID=72917 RepID=UPI001CB9974F|nr:uncharacterized protein LOC122604845 [Erigeron canadensis]
MKRITRTSGDRVLRSGKRFFTTRSLDDVQRVRFTSSDVNVVSIQETKKNILDNCLEIKVEKNNQDIDFECDGVLGTTDENKEDLNFGEFGIDKGISGISVKSQEVENVLDFKKISEVVDCDNVSRFKKFGSVYTRKRKRNIQQNGDNVVENNDTNDHYKGLLVDLVANEFVVFRKARSVVRRVRRVPKALFFNELANKEVKGTINGVVPAPSVREVEGHTVKARSVRKRVPRVLCLNELANKKVKFTINGVVQAPGVREASLLGKRVPSVPKVLCFNELVNRTVKGTINGVVPAPSLREVEGYAEQEFVPFVLPEAYIISRGDEVSRVLEKGYAVYDMDCDDEKWLERFNSGQFGDNGFVAEETFENVIDAFERGNYCNPNEYSDAALAVERCQVLASKEVLEALYRYWRNKRKKKRSPLIRAFQCNKRPIVKQHVTRSAQNRLCRRPTSIRCAEKELDLKKGMLNNQKVWEEVANMYMKVHETREAAKRTEETAIVKRQQAQALMEVADLAIYKAFSALRIAEALAASCSVTDTTSATFSLLDE